MPYYYKKTKEYFKRKENKVYEAKINIIYGLLRRIRGKALKLVEVVFLTYMK